MNLKHWENKARQSFWVVHMEAWRRSGLARTSYCKHHHLNRRTFDRWMEYLVGKEAARKHTEYQAELRREERLKAQERKPKRPHKRGFGVSTDVRSRALQAFWAMHVEAMNWSGMGLHEYAGAMFLSPYALRRWRDRLDDGEVEIDWRAHLHPSARPVVSTSANGTTPENLLTDARKDDPPPPRQPVRRFFSEEEKRAIAQETDRPGVSVSAVARKHGIVTGMLFRWRVQFGIVQEKRVRLASVVQTNTAGSIAVLPDLLLPPDGTMVVDLADGRRVFAPEGSDPDAVRAHVAAQEGGR